MAVAANPTPAFVPVLVTDAQIAKAEHIRQTRDAQYGNIYQEVDTDLRWCGDLGEIVVNDWLKRNGLPWFAWHIDNAAGKPDFTVSEVKIDVKTVKRKVAPRPDYTAQITAQHKDTDVDELFFCSYEFEKKTMWLLGGISKKAFLQHATFYKAGDAVHANYIIRKGHEIYNAPLSALTPPLEWIKRFVQ